MPAIVVVAVVIAANVTGGALIVGGAIGLGAIAGSVIIGAVAGGIIAAVQKKDILKGALVGGLIGGAVGYAGVAVGAFEGGGAAAATETAVAVEGGTAGVAGGGTGIGGTAGGMTAESAAVAGETGLAVGEAGAVSAVDAGISTSILDGGVAGLKTMLGKGMVQAALVKTGGEMIGGYFAGQAEEDAEKARAKKEKEDWERSFGGSLGFDAPMEGASIDRDLSPGLLKRPSIEGAAKAGQQVAQISGAGTAGPLLQKPTIERPDTKLNLQTA